MRSAERDSGLVPATWEGVLEGPGWQPLAFVCQSKVS